MPSIIIGMVPNKLFDYIMDKCKKNAKLAEQEYEQAVDPRLVDFIENVHSAPAGETNKLEYRISGVSERQRADIERITGTPLYATCNFIKGSAIEHIENRHGVNGAADRTMADINDVARIGFVIGNYDEADFARNRKGEISRSSEYKTPSGKPAPILLYVKKINGFYVVAEAVNDSRKKRLNVISAYKSKANPLENNKTQVPDGSADKPQIPQV